MTAGTGLGRPISRDLARAMGGELEVTSENASRTSRQPSARLIGLDVPSPSFHPST